MPMIGGKNYTEQQIADFYANGGNDVQFAQQNGLGRDDIISARQYAGGNTPNAQTFFNQYKAANPNGAYANNFAGWQNDLGTHTRDAMNSGTYTGNGADQSPTDYFNRTVHSGNIGVVAIDAVSSFVESSLTLPKLNDSLGMKEVKYEW